MEEDLQIAHLDVNESNKKDPPSSIQHRQHPAHARSSRRVSRVSRHATNVYMYRGLPYSLTLEAYM